MTYKPQQYQLETFSRRLVGLIFMLICTTLVANWPQMHQLFSSGGTVIVPRGHDYWFILSRLPREALLLGVVIYLGYGILTDRARLTYGAFRTLVAMALWALACVFYTVTYKNLPFAVPLFGLRIFQYLPLLIAGYILARKHKHYTLLEFATLLRWYVTPIIVFSIIQVVAGEGRKTIFGARAFGVFPNFNTFGATLLALCLWFLCARILHQRIYGAPKYGIWLGACAALSFTTGSRTAMTLSSIIVIFSIYPHLSKKAKSVLLAAIPIALCVFLAIASIPAMTGGRKVEKSNMARLKFMQEVAASFETPADLVFGSGVGLYTTSLVVAFGGDRFPGQVGNVHSVYLEIVGGFGIFGLLAYLYAFLISFRKGSQPETGFFLFIVGLLGIPHSLWGYFPADALLLFLWGHLLGSGKDTVTETPPEQGDHQAQHAAQDGCQRDLEGHLL